MWSGKVAETSAISPTPAVQCIVYTRAYLSVYELQLGLNEPLLVCKSFGTITTGEVRHETGALSPWYKRKRENGGKRVALLHSSPL